jgi:hypothetical protein
LMFISGAVYVTARFISGSWLSALAAHWIVNFAILLPRWYVAILFFRFC